MCELEFSPQVNLSLAIGDPVFLLIIHPAQSLVVPLMAYYSSILGNSEDGYRYSLQTLLWMMNRRVTQVSWRKPEELGSSFHVGKHQYSYPWLLGGEYFSQLPSGPVSQLGQSMCLLVIPSWVEVWEADRCRHLQSWRKWEWQQTFM